MKKIFIAILVISALSWGSLHQTEVKNFAQQHINLIVPCSYPLTYSVGNFDERFPIKKEELIASLERAEKSWEDGAGKQLFQYTETGGTLTINLIYDNRQQVTNTLKDIGTEIDDKEVTYDQLKKDYETLQKGWQSDQDNLQSDVSKVETMKKKFDQNLKAWNQSDKTSEETFQSLEREKDAINKLVVSVNQKQKDLKIKTDELNALGSRINNLIEELHLNVARFNTTATSNGEEYDEGEYVRNASGQSINIYEFGDETKLLRVLTHEMGHALGLDHVDDKDAIMYRSNQGKQEILTAADVAELKRVCRLK